MGGGEAFNGGCHAKKKAHGSFSETPTRRGKKKGAGTMESLHDLTAHDFEGVLRREKKGNVLPFEGKLRRGERSGQRLLFSCKKNDYDVTVTGKGVVTRHRTDERKSLQRKKKKARLHFTEKKDATVIAA